MIRRDEIADHTIDIHQQIQCGKHVKGVYIIHVIFKHFSNYINNTIDSTSNISKETE